MHVSDEIVSQIMALPPAARAELLALLQQSLADDVAPGTTSSDDQLTVEWTEELDRRVARMRDGESPGVDAETAFAQVRERVA